MRVHVVGQDRLITEMMSSRGHEVSSLKDAEIVIFTGGSDVTPRLYGMKPHPTTGFDIVRDLREKAVFEDSGHALRVGICRGAQFLCVLNDGILFQDIDNHCRNHNLTYTDENGLDSVFRVTSTHHQMMFPGYYDTDDTGMFELWGFCRESSYRDSGPELRNEPVRENEGPDKEIVFWPKTRCLGFQPHPEYGMSSCEDLFFQCLERALNRIP